MTRYAWASLALISSAALADESQFALKEGAGRDLVARNCAACHSLDYIQANSVFLDRKGWETEVNKMINVMHAPINTEDVSKLVDYLQEYYGKK